VIQRGCFVEEEKGDLGGNLRNEVGTMFCMEKNEFVAGRVVMLSSTKLAASHGSGKSATATWTSVWVI
jgi:hypothetical protein